MKKHISDFFAPIYEAYFLTLKEKTPVKENEKIADAIFHERAFVEWLRIQFKKKLTEKTYPKLANANNFKNYLKSYKKIKNRKEEFITRKLILDQVKLAKLKPVSKYEYDVDMVDAFFRTEKIISVVKTLEGFKKEDFLEAMKQPIIIYCKKVDLPFELILQMKYPIVVPNTTYGFEAYLGRTLIAFDENKIEAILGYQNAIWKGKGLFASFVEHGVYRYVKNNSPFDNNIRLAKIMNWVERNRYFLPHHEVSKNKIEKTPTLNYGIKKTDVSQFHYWPYSEDSLNKLYDALILNNKINENDSFCEHFKKYNILPKNPIEWKVSQKQLMYLLYLIYKEQKEYCSIPIHKIAEILFKNTKANFDAKILNTLLNQLIDDFKTRKPLSIGLKSIKTIFESLNLN
ncbi:MAG: hypothetical protein Q7W45_10755 [Bacteroidota bacterium]|nr:hypothetical protein [Bacteroidota bacterium]MDP3146065.1 hypothetical protein [Bacteroidota bacterium]